MAEARKVAEAEKRSRQKGGTGEREKEEEFESLNNMQLYRLLSKENKEIKSLVEETHKQQLDEQQKCQREIQVTRKELSDRIDGLKNVVDSNTAQLAAHNIKIQRLESEQQKWEVAAEEKFEILEVESRARNVKIKSISEEFGKLDLRKDLTTSLEDYLDEDEIRNDKVYRIFSRATVRKKQPRDILVSFDSKVVRNNLLKKHWEKPPKLADQDAQIFQDLPADTLKKRTQFHFLCQILIAKEIRYYWKIPFALEVTLPSGRKTPQQAQELADSLSQRPAPAQSLTSSSIRARVTGQTDSSHDARSPSSTQLLGTSDFLQLSATATSSKHGEVKNNLQKWPD